ncbi:MAG: F0F1 ATP synthase subunit alpha [Anaerolineae bacterium]|nr:F0F1 ATP synthase subunit alpha [Anaerolineae bacterium]
MSESASRPDVASVLRALRAQAEQIDVVRVRDVDIVKQISDKAAEILGIERIKPTVRPVVGLLREQASRIGYRVRFTDVGTVQQIGDGVAKLSGLPSARTEELVTFPTGVQGMILNLEHGSIDVILLGTDEGIQGGDLVTGSGERLQVPVGRKLLGRVVSPLGAPLDERGPIEAVEKSFLERDAPGIIDRVPVHEPLYTGLKVIDSMLAIGRGQRELIIGDRQTGKTTVAVDTIINQRESGVLCVYVAIGQKKSTVLSVIETLRSYHAMPYTTVVMASPDDPPALRYLAPYAGCAMAEALMYDGNDVLIVYDDLSKHADSYRELSLLLRRPPGREAYPGDIFYLHARLLERASKLGPGRGGGSLTALPIVETQQGNISAYIPTNLISITDGQIVLDTALFNRNIRPAVNVGASVSRVGGAAQVRAMRDVAGKLKLDLAQYQEVVRFARFGTEVDETTRRQIQRGMRLETALKQREHHPLSLAEQVIVLSATSGGYMDDIEPADVPAFERQLLEWFKSEHSVQYETINRRGELSEGTRKVLLNALVEYRAAWARR